MTRYLRSIGAVLVALVLPVVMGACGSSSSGPTVTVVQGTAPDYLDPSQGYTTQAANSSWVSYLGLYTYAHASATAGGQVIPAIATAPPKVTGGGKTYTITIRKGLKYSNGEAVKASDFLFTIERAIKLNWGGAAYFTGNIAGATDYSKGKSNTITGISANDATGQIVIHLTAPYGAFENVLAFPSAGLLPSTTPMTPQDTSPPSGFGPYEIKNVVPNQGYDVSLNPSYASQAIPGVPAGHVNIHVKIETNTTTEAEDVLNNSADVFDWGDTVPPSLLPQVQSQAASRYASEPTALVLYFFMNIKEKPFDNILARKAVIMALDRNALSRLDSGNITPGCYFLPPTLVGHPSTPCPYGDPSKSPNIAAAKKLVAEAGLTGYPVTVWGEERQPRKEYIDNYAATLNEIGFKATTKIIASTQYFPTIGTLKSHPQTGFADWQQDFPNPFDFYLLVDGSGISQVNNENFGEINDPFINSEIKALTPVLSSQLSSVASRWEKLDEYVAKKAYLGVFGYEKVPKFTSTRINFSQAIFHPVYGLDYTSLTLTK
ncbi:MAG TPA: ABC transporter substrate-binding protein [Solirubrobacteraceae bacterium]